MLFVAFVLVALFYLLPGLLLHALWRERGLTLGVCVAFGLASLVVVDVWAAALFNYHFPLQLAVNFLLIGGLAWLARRHLGNWWAWAQSQWPWPALGYAAVAAIFIVPAFVIPFPFDTDAQGFGLLTLTMRLGGSITSMSPFWPGIHYIYSPGFMLLAAQVADCLPGVPTDVALMALGHMLAVCVVGGMYAVGREFGDERVGGWAAFFCVIGYALFSSMMDSAYTTLLGLALTTGLLVLLFRAFREPTRFNIGLAVVALASLPLTQPDAIINLLIAYIPFYVTVWLARERPSLRQYLTLTIIVPALGIALCLPWLVELLPLMKSIYVHERQDPAFGILGYMFTLNGILVPVLAIGGLVIAMRHRRWFDLWLIGWVVMIVEISSLGNLDSISRRLASDPMQIFYPYGVAWHATIIPLAVLAAILVCALPTPERWIPSLRGRVALSGAVLALALLAGLFSQPIVQLSKGHLALTGSLSSMADRQAMLWLRDNTSADAFILNYPSIEGDWAPVIAERRTVQFREQLFYIGAAPNWAQQDALRTAFLNPAAPQSGEAIKAAGVDYVLVPQVMGRPDSFAQAMRWHVPFVEPMQSSFADASYLELMQDVDGAQVWKVKR
jgi:hypothetical protein